MQQWKMPKLKVSENSLFARLSRSPSWISFLIAAALLLLPKTGFLEKFKIMVMLLALPFIVTGFISLWNRRHLPSAAQIEKTIGEAVAMSRKDFLALLEEAFRREGYEVTRRGGAADLEISQGGRLTLVSCSRWKAAHHGQEPLKELVAAREAGEAREVRYICINPLTEQAEDYAAQNRIRLMRSQELARLLRLAKKKSR